MSSLIAQFKKYIFGALAAFVLLMMYAFFLHVGDSGGSLPCEDAKNFDNANNYSACGNRVYYNKPFRGYFEVPDVDVATFSSMSDVNDGGVLVKDKNHVYYKTEIIKGLNPAQVKYLGYNYLKNGQDIYYGKTKLDDADAATFKHISYYYAKDKNHVFYKEKIINGADAATARPVKFDEREELTFNYLRDATHVYYNGGPLKDAVASNFTVLRIEDGRTQDEFAFDGRHYYYENLEILINGDDKLSTGLKLLSKNAGFSHYAVFYKDKSMYGYFPFLHVLNLIGTRDNTAPFKEIDHGIFTDGSHIYFTFHWGGFALHKLGMAMVPGVNLIDFKPVGQFEIKGDVNGVIYQSGKNRFFHPSYPSGVKTDAGLSVLEDDGSVEDVPVNITKANYFDETEPEMSWKTLGKMLTRDTDYNDH